MPRFLLSSVYADEGLRNPETNPEPHWVEPKKFQMKVITEALISGEFVTSIDLQDSYFHIAIAEKDRRFLHFAVGTRAFKFQVLPFGLSTAPRVFTRVVPSLISHLCKLGFKIFAYIDDLLLEGKDYHSLLAQTQLAIQIFQELGFIVNMVKLEPILSQFPTYLGATLDMHRGLVRSTLLRDSGVICD